MQRQWATNENGTVEYILLTPKYLEGALEVLNNFFMHETVCIAVGLPQHPEAILELKELTMRTIKDGVSVIAIEKLSGKVIGAAFNKLQVKDSNQETYFENYGKKCKHSSSRAVVQFMIDADATCDLFDLCKIDCLLEIMFLATLPKYRGNGIASKLCEVSIEVAKALLNGKNVKEPIDGKPLNLVPTPKAVSAIFTSFISQKIGKKLGFQIATTTSYEDFFHEGKTYASVVGNITSHTTLEFKKL